MSNNVHKLVDCLSIDHLLPLECSNEDHVAHIKPNHTSDCVQTNHKLDKNSIAE